MATDVIISAFATPGGSTSKFRQFAQPVDIFRSAPLVIDVNGIGSDEWMGPSDTVRKPREPWGGAPFSREAARYRDQDGSILRKLLQQRARGTDVGRIALVGFSAGGTFLKNILDSEIDRKMVDTAIYLDALNFAKTPNGVIPPAQYRGTADFAAHAIYTGFQARQKSDPKLWFVGPMFITSHTHIKQSKALEAQVANTTDSSEAAFGAALQMLQQGNIPGFDISRTDSIGTLPVNMSNLVSPSPGPFPLTIGAAQGVPAPDKTWTSMPMPAIPNTLGNFFDLDYGGTVAADHVFQAWYVQGAIWRTFLAPRWNAIRDNPYTVAGLGAWSACCPGGNYNAGFYDTGPSLLLGAAGLLGGFLAGRELIKRL